MVEIWQIIFVGGILSALILLFIYYLIKKIRKRSSKYRKPDQLTDFKCLDGHVVKSKGELIIDNFLYLNGIQHKYEKKIKIRGQTIKTDWYLPKYKVYIEYWGYYGKAYMKRKKKKLKLYKKANIKLVSIENEMFHDIYYHLKRYLKKYVK